MATLITRLKNKNCIKVTEELLREYKYIKLGLESLKEQLKMIEEDITTLPAIECSERVQMSVSGSPTENSALEIIEQKELIEKKIKENEFIINRIEIGLNNLDLIHRQVIEYSVIERQNWVWICRKLNYSETQLREKKKEALKSIAYSMFGYNISGEDNLLNGI